MRTTNAPIAFNRYSNSRTLGMLWLAYGVLRAAAAIWTILYSGTLTVMFGALLNRVPNPFAWMTMFHIALVGMVVLDVIACVASIVAGVALLGGTSAARTWALVAAFFGLINGPLGIALGVFTVALLLPRPTAAGYANVATAA
jgi:hypothetical protein